MINPNNYLRLITNIITEKFTADYKLKSFYYIINGCIITIHLNFKTNKNYSMGFPYEFDYLNSSLTAIEQDFNRFTDNILLDLKEVIK